MNRNPEHRFSLGSWNVRTLLQPGRIKELVDQVKVTGLDAIALQETRWSGSGQINQGDYIFYYSGPTTRTGQAGTGFLIKRKLVANILNFEPISDRIAKLRLRSKYNNITLINVYAPTETSEDVVKEVFYAELQLTLDNIPNSDTTIVLGDLNAQLGKEPRYKSVVGSHTLHQETNNNGEYLCEFAILNNLYIMSTYFQHKPIHKGTWVNPDPDSDTLNQIDHVLINSNKKEIIHDVRSLRGPNVDSDHFLQKIVIQQVLPRIYKKKKVNPANRWNKANMQNPAIVKEYKSSIFNALRVTPDLNDPNEEWGNLKNIIIQSAAKTIQTQKPGCKNYWWDEDCRKAIEEKNNKRKIYLYMRTRANFNAYVSKRNYANKLCRSKKKTWLNNQVTRAEEALRKNDTRKFFQDIKQYVQKNNNSPNMCRLDDGSVISQREQVLERWKQYYEDLLNVRNDCARQEQQPPEPSNRECDELQPPSFNEICNIINKLKNNKAAGPDNIPAELIKLGGRSLRQRLHKLICQVWTSEQLPNEWNESHICPIFKKGDRLMCSNYRPISILNIIYKILAIILNNRLSALLEDDLEECQNGFRPNRSTVDNIFMIRQIFEKCYEHNIELYNIFIDFTHAFDSINRDKIFEILGQYNVPPKLVRLIRLTLKNTTARVKVNGNCSQPFMINSGVKQGDPLSATLFCLVLDSVLKSLELRGNISSKMKQCVAYADDILLVARSKHALEDLFIQLQDASTVLGLHINENKSKYMHCTRKTYSVKHLEIGANTLKQVDAFTYLGSKLTTNNSVAEEIKERIAMGNKAYYANLSLFKSKLLSKNTKLRIYQTLIRPVTTYACETWTLQQSLSRKLLIFERKILRKIFGPTKDNDGTWRIKTNDELNRIVKNRNIIAFIKAQRLSWLGHVHRMSEDRSVKKIYSWKPLAVRKAGRPKTRWMDDVIQDLHEMKIVNWRDRALDRRVWKEIIEKAKTFPWKLLSFQKYLQSLHIRF